MTATPWMIRPVRPEDATALGQLATLSDMREQRLRVDAGRRLDRTVDVRGADELAAKLAKDASRP